MNQLKLQAIEYGLNTFFEIYHKLTKEKTMKTSLFFKDESGNIFTANSYKTNGEYPSLNFLDTSGGSYCVRERTLSYLSPSNVVFSKMRQRMYSNFDWGPSYDYFDSFINNPELLLDVIEKIASTIDYETLDDCSGYLYDVKYPTVDHALPFIKFPSNIELLSFAIK